MKVAKRLVCALAMGSALVTIGCKPDAAVEKGEVIGQGMKAPVPPPAITPHHDPPPIDAGVITGTILFSGKVPGTTIDTSMDPACALGGASGKLPVEQYVVKNGRLANVFLYVKSGRWRRWRRCRGLRSQWCWTKRTASMFRM